MEQWQYRRKIDRDILAGSNCHSDIRLRAVARARGLEGIEDPALGLESLCSGLVKPPACDWISL